MATNCTKKYPNTKVEEALDLIQCLSLTESDFLDLAMACLDQGGLGAHTQSIIAKTIGMESLRDADVPMMTKGQA